MKGAVRIGAGVFENDPYGFFREVAVTGLDCGTEHISDVRVAEDEIDDSSTDGAPRTEQSIVSVTPPIAPSGLSANMSNAGVTLGWESNSDNEKQFKVYYRTELI